MDLRKAAVPAAILFGGALLAGCGDTANDTTDGTDPATDPIIEDTMAPLDPADPGTEDDMTDTDTDG